jgi:hypothetical protein
MWESEWRRKMKTLQWLRNNQGVFEQVGVISNKVKWVRIEFLDAAGTWQKVGRTEYKGEEAFQIITSAIDKKQTGKWHGYRLVPVEKAEKAATKRLSKRQILEQQESKEKKEEEEGESRQKMDKFSAETEQDYLKQEEDMAKQEKKVEKPKTEKVLGYFRKGTAIGYMAETLEDEHPHKLSVIFAHIKKTYKKHPEFRLTVFKKMCKERGLAGVLVDRDADTIQIKKGKGHPIPGKKAVHVAKAPAKKPNGAAAQDQSSEVAKWVRHCLKSGDTWTKNKVIERIKTDHGVEPKMIQAAIAAEIRAGGVAEKDGELSLT